MQDGEGGRHPQSLVTLFFPFLSASAWVFSPSCSLSAPIAATISGTSMSSARILQHLSFSVPYNPTSAMTFYFLSGPVTHSSDIEYHLPSELFIFNVSVFSFVFI